MRLLENDSRLWRFQGPATMSQSSHSPDSTPDSSVQPAEASGRWIVNLTTHLALVFFCLGIPIALLLPAVQAAREAARRSQCHGNHKGIVIALHHYHDTHKMLPMGVQIAGGPNAPGRHAGQPVLGPSWWYAILPFFEYGDMFDRIQETQQLGHAAPVFNAHQLRDHQVRYQDRPLPFMRYTGESSPGFFYWVPGLMRCPSSPLPVMETKAGPIELPTYVGISGGTDISHLSADYVADGPPNGAPISAEFYVNQNKGSGPWGSIVTSSGMLPPAQHVTFSQCTDGLSNTLIVAEQSDWLRDVNPRVRTRYHGDPGWNQAQYGWQPRVGAGGLPTASAGGWISGTEDAVDPVGPAADITDHSSAPGDWVARSLFNITTVRYPLNLKRVMKGPGAGYPGCAQVMGHNNPLQSPHSGGIVASYADGSIGFIADTTDFAIVLRLVIRDDVQSVEP